MTERPKDKCAHGKDRERRCDQCGRDYDPKAGKVVGPFIAPPQENAA